MPPCRRVLRFFSRRPGGTPHTPPANPLMGRRRRPTNGSRPISKAPGILRDCTRSSPTFIETDHQPKQTREACCTTIRIPPGSPDKPPNAERDLLPHRNHTLGNRHSRSHFCLARNLLPVTWRTLRRSCEFFALQYSQVYNSYYQRNRSNIGTGCQ